MQRTLFDSEDDFKCVITQGKRGFGMSNHSIQETSKMALDELKESGKLESLQQEYADTLWDKGVPSSDNEINFKAGYYPDDKFAPRRRELEKKGYLVRCNKGTCSVTGKLVNKFWFTDKGLELVGKEG
jgi:hypothetical protein